jgi:hypothetical protein
VAGVQAHLKPRSCIQSQLQQPASRSWAGGSIEERGKSSVEEPGVWQPSPLLRASGWRWAEVAGGRRRRAGGGSDGWVAGGGCGQMGDGSGVADMQAEAAAGGWAAAAVDGWAAAAVGGWRVAGGGSGRVAGCCGGHKIWRAGWWQWARDRAGSGRLFAESKNLHA